MKYLKTFEKYDPIWDYILYMENDSSNWIRVDDETRKNLMALIKGEIDSFTTTKGTKQFLAKLEDSGNKKKGKIISFSTDEGIEDYISVKTILNKLT
jgi:hypothetical protein